MANATQQNKYKVQLTRSKLELLEKLLDQEILEPGSSYAHPNIHDINTRYINAHFCCNLHASNTTTPQSNRNFYKKEPVLLILLFLT